MKSVILKYMMVTVVASFAVVSAFAQDEILETPSALFLEVLPDARAAGMGGINQLTSQNVYGIFSNASANLFGASRGGLGVNMSARKGFSEGNMFTLGSYYNIDGNNTVALGVRHFIHQKTFSGMGNDSFTPKETAIDIAYGRRIIDNLSISATLRYIFSDMGSIGYADNAKGFAADLGITYFRTMNVTEGSTWSVGFAIANVGQKLKYVDRKYSIPTTLRLGGSVYLPFEENHKLTASLNMGYRLLPSDFSSFQAGIGAEYNFFKYGIVRAGYHLGDEGKGMGNFATLGAGVKLKPVRVDFSYWAGVKEADYKNIMYISVSAMF